MHDLIIIGAGPAGLTASLYAGRFRLNTLVLERMSPGGQIILAQSIENFPGFPGGIFTGELIDRFKKQIEELNINTQIEEVIEIIPNPEAKIPLYNVKTSSNSYQTKSIIIATGAQSKKIGIEGEGKLMGKGVSYCATCDGPMYKNKEVMVIGSGDRAIEEAIFLTSFAQKVTVIHRRQELRASKILQEKAKNNPKINFVLDSVVEEIIGQNKVETVRIKNLKTNSFNTFDCQGVFIFAGIIPNTNFVKNLLLQDESGFIITDQEMKTEQAGIFACGDCRKKSLYQVVTACAEGAIATDSVHKYLLNL